MRFSNTLVFPLISICTLLLPSDDNVMTTSLRHCFLLEFTCTLVGYSIRLLLSLPYGFFLVIIILYPLQRSLDLLFWTFCLDPIPLMYDRLWQFLKIVALVAPEFVHATRGVRAVEDMVGEG